MNGKEEVGHRDRRCRYRPLACIPPGKQKVLALARRGPQPESPADVIKEPFVLEFLGLDERAAWRERDFEQLRAELARDRERAERALKAIAEPPKPVRRGRS